VSAVTFVVEGKPQGKQRPRFGKGGRVYTPSPTRRYEQLIAWSALAERGLQWRMDGHFTVSVTCYFPDARRRDADNVLKSCMDGLNGILYADDCQVVTASVTKAIDREHPRTVVTVTRAEP